MVTGSENKGLPFQPFHRPRYNSGGAAWLLSGAILACGVAVPGLCFAWHLKQVTLAASVLITCWERCLWHCCTTLRATLCHSDAVKLQTKVAEPLPLMVSIDAVFILSATVFLLTGGLLGKESYGISSKYPGMTDTADVSIERASPSDSASRTAAAASSW